MMSHTYAPLDVEKFRKTAELARRTTFFGERQGALAACTRIAASAGLNLEEAAKLAGVQLGKTIQEFEDALRAEETLREQDEARRKAEEEARRKEEDAARQKEEAARHEEQIARDKCDANIKTRELQSGYFSLDTFESIFIQACITLQQEKGQTPLDKKSRYGSIDGFDGAENTLLSQELRDAICLACPLPSRFAQAWDEW